MKFGKMKYWVLLAGLLLTACQNPGRQKGGRAASDSDNKVQSMETNKQEGVKVVIQVTQTESYCGGAAPSPEMEARMYTPVPLPEKKVFLKKGEKNNPDLKPLVSLTSDAKGMIVIYLSPGVYNLVDDRKHSRDYYNSLLKNHEKETESYSAINKECLEQWVVEPELTLIVESDKENVFVVNFNKDCPWRRIPCVGYKGNYPP